ncbi:MAG: DUF4189 domain-containing protein [Xanthobacteraceae bacterium]|nr:DUF4189 domain-containing protein [Xanthobacteraceae bacterium]
MFVSVSAWRRRAIIAIIVSVAAAAPMPGTAFAAGALAIGKCGTFGQAIDYPAQAAAVAAARKQCKGDCSTITMSRSCAAFAVDMANPCGSFGQAVAPHISSALNAATRYCYQYGGKECVIRAWACDAKG